jgi:hypothetical protein
MSYITVESANYSSFMSASTIRTGYHTSSLGYIPYTSSDSRELYTGQFQGTTLRVTAQTSIGNQTEKTKIQFGGTGSFYTTSSLKALYQNVSGSVRSTRFFNLQYNSNQLVPNNLGLITQSMSTSVYDNYNTYTNPLNPYAYVQDYNYSLNSFTTPRYYGSKTVSTTYNTYTQGDTSYGNTAAIDKLKFQYAYLVDLYSSSIQMPGRVNAQIKFILTNDQNVLNLTKANENLFTVQNVFKSGENIDVALFNYDPSDPNVQYFTNNQNITLFEGGFRYSPVLYNLTGSNSGNNVMNYIFKSPLPGTTQIQVSGSNQYSPPNDSNSIANFITNFTSFLNPVNNQIAYTATITSSIGGATTQNLRFGLRRTATTQGLLNGYADQIYFAEFPLNTPSPVTIGSAGNGILPGDFTNFNSPTLFDVSAYTTGSVSQVNYSFTFNSVAETDSRWYAVNNTTIRLTATQSAYYGVFTYGGNTSSLGIDTPVFPFVLNYGDMVRFYNVSSSTFGAQDEYRVVSTYQAAVGGTNYYYINLDRGLSPNNVDSGSFPSYISKYMALKKIPDETNLIINFSSSANIVQDGLIFPQYLNPVVKGNSGNLIKALKQQNLI